MTTVNLSEEQLKRFKLRIGDLDDRGVLTDAQLEDIFDYSGNDLDRSVAEALRILQLYNSDLNPEATRQWAQSRVSALRSRPIWDGSAPTSSPSGQGTPGEDAEARAAAARAQRELDAHEAANNPHNIDTISEAQLRRETTAREQADADHLGNAPHVAHPHAPQTHRHNANQIDGLSTGGNVGAFGDLTGQATEAQLPTPATDTIANTDSVMFWDGARKKIVFTSFVDRVRSNMAAATTSAKGLMTAAQFNKLAALPTNAALNTLLNAKQASLTSAQLAVVNAVAFTSELRTKLNALPTNTALNALLAAKQATLTAGSIGTNLLADAAVTARKIGAGQLRSSHFPGTSQSPSPTIQSKDIGRNQIIQMHIAPDTIERGMMRDESVGEDELVAALLAKINGKQAQLPDGTTNGDILAWDGDSWERAAAPTGSGPAAGGLSIEDIANFSFTQGWPQSDARFKALTGLVVPSTNASDLYLFEMQTTDRESGGIAALLRGDRLLNIRSAVTENSTIANIDNLSFSVPAKTTQSQHHMPASLHLAMNNAGLLHLALDTFETDSIPSDTYYCRLSRVTAAGGAGGGLTPEQSAAIAANTAKVGITPEQAAQIIANRDAAVAAQLDAATVIEIGPEFIHSEVGPKTLGINIRHPANAYRTATLMTVSPAGQPAVIVGYDPTLLHQDTLAEVSAVVLQNIWDQTDAIDDGMGGTVNVQRYPLGSYIPVEIRLITGRGGDTVFIRVIEVLVVADPATQITRIANERAAAVVGPNQLVNTITSFDGDQNRFEDVNGNEVTVPDGALVFLTEAVYQAAVADAQFTPNVNAAFFTR